MENHYLRQATLRLANRLIPYLFLAIPVLLANPAAAQQSPGSEVIALPDRSRTSTAWDQQQPVSGVDRSLLLRAQAHKKKLHPTYPEQTTTDLARPRLAKQAGDNPSLSDSIIWLEGVDPAQLRAKSYRNTIGSSSGHDTKDKELVPQRAVQPDGLLPVTDSQLFVPGWDPAEERAPRSREAVLRLAPTGNDGTVLALPDTGEPDGKDSLIYINGIEPMLYQNEQDLEKTASASNLPPVAIPDVFTVPFNEPLVVSAPGHLANDSDPEGDPLEWISFGLPANGSVTGASTDGAFTYTPEPGFSGTDSFVITITDGQGNFTDGLVIILVEPNFGPRAVPDVYTTQQGEPLVVSAPGHLANDIDPEGDPISWVSFVAAANGTVSGTSTNGAFTYTPDPGFSGINSFVITISDGQGNFASGLVIILVEPNLAPTVVPNIYTTQQDEPLVVSAAGHLANDIDPEGDPISWVSFVAAANGTISGTSTDGAFTYTPDSGFSGTDSFVVTISDGQGNVSSGLVSILVEENYSPMVVPDVYATQEGQALVVSAPGHLANDTDPEGDPLAWVSFMAAANGTVSGTSTDGAFTYTPDPGFSGTDSLVITISDGKGNFSSGLVTISVEPAAQDELFAVPDVFNTQQNEPLVVSAPGHLANDIDPEGDPISWVSFVAAANGNVSGTSTDGAFTYTPDPGFSGTDSFVVTISDGQGNLSSSLVIIFVEENYAPTAVPDIFTTQQTEPLVVSAPGHLVNDIDPEGDPISWVSFVAAANGNVSGTSTDGAFTYTPDPGFSGTDSFVVTITDGQGNFSSGLVVILVEENFAPEVVPDVFNTQQNEPLVVSAPGHLANDMDPEGDPLSWISFGPAANGTVSGASTDGAFTYTPDTGFTGTDSFVITISDGHGNFSSGLVSIYVEENLAPTAVPDVYTTPQGEPLVVSAPGHLANDTDPEGDPLVWISFGPAANGTVSGALTDGAFTYTPDPGFAGIDQFTITISDGRGNFTSGLVAILVEPNNPPIADAGADLTVVAGLPVTLDGTGSFDPDGDPITFSWTFATTDASDPIPPSSNAVLAGTNTAHPSFTTDLPGIYSVQLIVNDGFKDSAPDYVVVTALTIPEALDQLQEAIGVLADDGVLNKGLNKALFKKIEKALDLFYSGKINATLDILANLRQQILDLWLINGVFTEGQAMALLAQIDAIVSAIKAQQEFTSNDTADVQKINEATAMGENSFYSIQEQKPMDESVMILIYPNPFSLSTNAVYHLPEATNTRLLILDAFGREVRMLSTGFQEAGSHELQLEATGLSSGTYFVQLTTGNGYTVFKRIILIR